VGDALIPAAVRSGGVRDARSYYDNKYQSTSPAFRSPVEPAPCPGEGSKKRSLRPAPWRGGGRMYPKHIAPIHAESREGGGDHAKRSPGRLRRILAREGGIQGRSGAARMKPRETLRGVRGGVVQERVRRR